MAWLRENRIDLVRQPIRWAEIEAEPGRPDWSSLDLVVQELEASGIRWVASLETTPSWARRDASPPEHWMLCLPREELTEDRAVHQPPTDPEDLARFAAALAGRYQETLAAVEIWREPNLMPRWREGGPDPEDYARLLVPVADAVGQAAPGLPRLSAGLAPTRELGVCALSDLVFMDRLARTGALSAVDGIGSLPLGLRDAPTARHGSRDRLNLARAEIQSRVLKEQGIDLPIWALAWGWRVGEPDSPWGGHSPSEAAAWTRQGWSLARDAWPWMGPMLLWHLDPASTELDPSRGFALLTQDGRPTALGEAAASIATGSIDVTVLPPAEPEAPRVRWWIVLLGLLAFALVLGAYRGLPLLFARAAPLLCATDRWSDLGVGMAYAVLVAIGLLGPWPAATAVLPLLGLLAIARPAVALAAVPAVAPFWYGLRLSLGPRALAPVEGLLAIALAGAFVRARLSAPAPVAPALEGDDPPTSLIERLRRAMQPLDAAVLLLVVWGALSMLWADRLPEAAREWRTVLLEPALFYLLLRLGRREAIRRAARLGLHGLTIGASLAALWGLFAIGQHMLGGEAAVVAVDGVLRARGPYASPNNLSLLLGRAAAITAAAVLFAKGRSLRLVYTLALALIGLAWLATFSRGGLLFGLPPTLLILALLYAMDRRKAPTRRLAPGARSAFAPRPAVAIIVGALMVVGLLLAPFAQSERLQGALSFAPGSTGYIRLALWRSAWQMGLDHPWLGVGPDQFLHHYAERYVARDVVQERFLNHPHQLMLDWWTRLGLPGIALLGWLVLGQLGAARLAWRKAPADRRWTIVAAVAALIYALGHGLVDNHFFLVDLAIVAWLCQATLLAEVGAPVRDGERR